MRRLRIRDQVSVLAVTAVLLGLLGAQVAGGWSTTKLEKLGFDNDHTWNYDFESQSVSSTNVDWPLGLLFWNDAEIDKVKNDFSVIYDNSGSKMNERVNDAGATWTWDQDGGRKTSQCPVSGDSYHFRIYAPSDDDRFYNVNLGYYIVGSTHIDHNECGFGTWFGKSERAEEYLVGWARDVYGPARVDNDLRDFHNHHDYREEGNHIWHNSGRASYFKVP